MQKSNGLLFLNLLSTSISSLGMNSSNQALHKSPLNTTKQLFRAIKNNRPSRIEKIIKNSPAIINQFGSYPDVLEGLSALHVAAADGYSTSVQLLLNYGANPNNLTANQHSPLHYARNAQSAQFLINAGAKIDQEDHIGQTPLFYSLIKPPCRKLHTYYCCTSSYDVAKTLLNAGAQIDKKNYAKNSPLQEAVKHEQVRAVAFLLSYGENWHQWYADKIAVFNFVINSDQSLFFRRFNIQAIYNLMQKAIKNKNLVFLKTLLEHGIDFLAERDAHYGNWLHYAIKCDNPQALELMIESGVNPLDRNIEKETATEYAIKNNKTNCTASLNKALCKHLAHALYHYTYEQWKTIAQQITDVNIPIDSDHNTLLHTICRIGTSKHIDLLIALGADPSW